MDKSNAFHENNSFLSSPCLYIQNKYIHSKPIELSKKINNQRLKSTLFYSAHVELMKFSFSDLSQRWSVYEEAWYLISGSCLAVAALLMINVTFWSWWRLTINQVLSCINTTMTDWSKHGKLKKKKNLFKNRKQI